MYTQDFLYFVVKWMIFKNVFDLDNDSMIFFNNTRYILLLMENFKSAVNLVLDMRFI